MDEIKRSETQEFVREIESKKTEEMIYNAEMEMEIDSKDTEEFMLEIDSKTTEEYFDDNNTNNNSDINEFTICGFKNPSNIQWYNDKNNNKPFELTDIIKILNNNHHPRVLELGLSWDNGNQQIVVLNIIKNSNHKYCTFDIPVFTNKNNNKNNNNNNNNVNRNINSNNNAINIELINDYYEDEDMNHVQHRPSIPIVMTKKLSELGEHLTFEEFLCILCNDKYRDISIKLEFCDLITIQESSKLILKYYRYFGLDNVSCIWYHGIFLHEFPISNYRNTSYFFNKNNSKKKNSDKFTYIDFIKFVDKIQGITYSLSWPKNKIPSKPAQLQLCLKSLLSEISMGHEHDILIHFPINYVYNCKEIINELITNNSYFPYLAFNFYNIYRNKHNFNFKNINYKIKHNNVISIKKDKSVINFNTFQSKNNKPSMITINNDNNNNHHNITYNKSSSIDLKINNNEKEYIKTEHIVLKSDLKWLKSHIHQLFCFHSIKIVRTPENIDDIFKKILTKHNVPEWSGRLSWNPYQNYPSTSSPNNSSSHLKTPNTPRGHFRISSIMSTSSALNNEQPMTDFNLWQLCRLNQNNNKYIQSIIHNNNIGLAPKYNGWLISKRELKPPYRIKGRFFAKDKTGILSIYIRCSSIEYPSNNDVPSFGIGIHIGNEKLKIETVKLNLNNNKKLVEVCDIGTCIDNGYNFSIVDRGVMYPIECQVERTGKDGRGDNFPKGIKLNIPYTRLSYQWMFNITLLNTTNDYIIVDRLFITEKKFAK